MQIKNNHLKNTQTRWIIGLLKLLLLAGCIFFLYDKLKDQSISFDNIKQVRELKSILLIVSLLMFANWYLEALRWKLSINLFEPISINDAWKAVLGGLALNWVLPFTSGDLLARISQQQDKYQATSAVMLNRGIMLLITIFLGLGGLRFIARQYDFDSWFLLGVLFGIPLLKRLFKKSVNRFLAYFKELTRSLLINIISLSVLRYAVFVIQFYLLLRIFMPSLEADLLIAGIGWVFLVRSILPLFFGGIGVREASGVFFFEPYIADIQLVIIPIFLIWIINTVVPSLAGLIFIWRLKLR